MDAKLHQPHLTKEDRRQMVRNAWDAFHPTYMGYHLREHPNYYEFFRNGGVNVPEMALELAGDVKNLHLLDICCAGDAQQAFSWENLGARVVACDVSSAAIEIAKKNAEKLGSSVEFHVADAQTLTPIPGNQFDLVYATYICWFEDLYQATQSWYNVLKPEGRLLLLHYHPVVACLKEQGSSLTVRRSYFDTEPRYSKFTGTGQAEKYGGWDKDVTIVEFFHPLSAIVTALGVAGFRIKRLMEVPRETQEPSLMSKLPTFFGLEAQK